MSSLPIDVCAVIWKLLDTDDLISAGQTCIAWREHINASPSLWQHAHFHYKLSEDYLNPQHDAQPQLIARYKPNVALVQERLQTRKLHRLRITAHIRPRLRAFARGHIRSFIAAKLLVLYRSEERPPLYLRVEGLDSHWDTVIENVTRTTRIGQLDLATEGDQCDAPFLAEQIARRCNLRHLRIYPQGEEPPLFFGSHDGVPMSNPGYEGLVSMALAVCEPQMAGCTGEGCTETWPIDLSIPDNMRFLRLRRGRWDILNTANSMLQTLYCEDLYGLSRKWDKMEIHCFKHLVRFHLSFKLDDHNERDPVPPIHWTDLMTIIRSTIGPNLEVLYLDLPKRIGGMEQREYDDVWMDRIEVAAKLKHVTLVNYFPSTLEYLGGDESRPALSLKTFILIGYQIYEEMLFNYCPGRLSNLQVLDLAGTSFHKRLPASKKENWLQAWKAVKSVAFRLPL